MKSLTYNVLVSKQPTKVSVELITRGVKLEIKYRVVSNSMTKESDQT